MLSTISIALLEEVGNIEPVHAGRIVLFAAHSCLPVDWVARDMAEAGPTKAVFGGDVGLRLWRWRLSGGIRG